VKFVARALFNLLLIASRQLFVRDARFLGIRSFGAVPFDLLPVK